MSVGVVDFLEVVKVNEYGDNLSRLPFERGESLAEAVRQRDPVGETRQGVVERLESQCLFCRELGR